MEPLHLTLAELCSNAPAPMRREYSCFLDVCTSSPDHTVVLVALRVLADALRGDPIWASTEKERTNETFNLQRYLRALASVQAKQPIYHPWLSFREGRIRVVDGRHRLYALLDEKYTHARIVADPPDLAAVLTLRDDSP